MSSWWDKNAYTKPLAPDWPPNLADVDADARILSADVAGNGLDEIPAQGDTGFRFATV